MQVPTQDFFIKDMGIPLSMEPGVCVHCCCCCCCFYFYFYFYFYYCY